MKWKEIKTNYNQLLQEFSKKTPYEILGVNPSSSIDEIKIAYIKLVKV